MDSGVVIHAGVGKIAPSDMTASRGSDSRYTPGLDVNARFFLEAGIGPF